MAETEAGKARKLEMIIQNQSRKRQTDFEAIGLQAIYLATLATLQPGKVDQIVRELVKLANDPPLKMERSNVVD